MDVEFQERIRQATALLKGQYIARGLNCFPAPQYHLGVNLRPPEGQADEATVSSLARTTACSLGLGALVTQPQMTAGGTLAVYVNFVEQKDAPLHEPTAPVVPMRIEPTNVGPPQNLFPDFRRRYGGCGEGCTD